MLYLSLIKVFLISTSAFFIGIAITPVLTNWLYKNKMWKKKSGKIAPDGGETPIFNELHKDKEVGTPRMGGVVIWGSVFLTALLFWIISLVWPDSGKFNFISRNQTWLPLFTLLVGSLVGLIDDWMQIKAETDVKNAGLPFSRRLIVVIILGLIGGYWFYFKLGMVAIAIPFLGSLTIGPLIIPLFILVMIALFSSGVIDGLDGLSGGIMAIIFASYTGIAFFQSQFDLAAFCGAVTGGLLAFLWFNIPPARFYMSETGILGLTTALTVVVFLTDSVATLPIIALPLVITVLSVIIQLASKKFRHGKKVFKVAPLHHHFEAIGWPAHKVVMRYWVIGIIFAIIGLIITLVGVLK
jgi:phospho-N-acetylmuramoyl-pentapeptide-transferase